MPNRPPTRATLRVLLVDDSEDDAELVLRALSKAARTIEHVRVDNAPAMLDALDGHWDVIIADWAMPSFSGEAALSLVKERRLDVPFIIMSGTVTEETTVRAMRAGARDCVLKDKLARLVPAIERELAEQAERAKAAEALRRSEAQLRQAQKLEAIGGLAAGVAHDFNNLLSVISCHAELMSEGLSEADPMFEGMNEIKEAAGRASELTRQLLAFSRQQVLEPRLSDLNQIVAGTEKMLRRIIGEDIDLRIVGAPALAPAMVDPGQIEQVILNLVVNARDAMPRGGKLTIETANVELDARDAAEPGGPGARPHVMLAVTDTGTGMDEATRARIFEPFFTTKEPGRGTGLGLATVFGIVQQSGGTIWTYSELGRGTTFKIYLPRVSWNRADARERAKPASTATPSLRGAETILLVEDDESVRGVERAILRRFGYHVLDVPSGADALLLCEQHRNPIDLLLTDVVMPRMSGRELADRLLSLRPRLKVLFLSGYGDGAIAHHGVLEPGMAFMQKPVTPEALARKVRAVLDDQ